MQKRNIIALSIIAFLGLLLAFFQTPLMQQARAATWDGWVIIVGRTFGLRDISGPQDTQARLQELVAENTRLKAELSDLRQLREELATPPVDNLRPVPAAVVGRPLDTLQSELIISRGLADGIAIHNPVVVHGSTLIGFVTEVQDTSARVQTLFHPATHIPVHALNLDEENPPAAGLLESHFYSALFITTVPRDVTLELNQAVVSVPDETGTPGGLSIGAVASIEGSEHEAYQSARVKPDYDIDRINSVTVLAQP